MEQSEQFEVLVQRCSRLARPHGAGRFEAAAMNAEGRARSCGPATGLVLLGVALVIVAGLVGPVVKAAPGQGLDHPCERDRNDEGDRRRERR